jgi:hypothetical protein
MFENIQKVSSVGITVFVACAIAGGIGTAIWERPYPIVAGMLLGVYFLFAIKVAAQWEKVALLRFGKYVGLCGPGYSPSFPSSTPSAATWINAYVQPK